MLSTVDGISVISNTLGRLTTTRHTRGHTRDQRLYFFSVLFFFHKPNIINPTSIQHSTPIQHSSNTLDRLIVPHEVRGCTLFSSFLFSPTKHFAPKLVNSTPRTLGVYPVIPQHRGHHETVRYSSCQTQTLQHREIPLTHSMMVK